MNYPPPSDSPRPSSVGSTQSNHSGSNFSTKHGHGPLQDICVGEELKIAVDVALERFRLSEEQQGKPEKSKVLQEHRDVLTDCFLKYFCNIM